SVNSQYGTLQDFKDFLAAAHERGLRVITELVLNHTSDQHPWFQRARRAPPGSVERDYYVWSDSPEKYKDVRIIFQDFEPANWTWDPIAKSYYWHRFYSHQPDLNFDSPAVWNAVLPLLDYWMEMGVDGMRLDAVPYLYEREGTNCENLPETHKFLKVLRSRIDARFGDRMLLAEANQWPEDAVDYFGQGDECHMSFHFPLMPRLFMAIHMEDPFPVVDILDQTPAIPSNCQWAMFLRNHDELTLEMVTDEERDYMYRAYALDPRARINLGIRRRLAPLLGNNRRRIELMNGLLFSMPGTPIVYYGDEIGMGDNIYLGDRNGVRTPMQWSGDRNAGFSKANPQSLYLPVVVDPEYHYEAVNVEAQQNNPHSLLWWMKRLIALRKRHKAFGRGTLEIISGSNRKILGFVRRFGEECILVVANLSRFVQHANLDLKQFSGLEPVELFGGQKFPRIDDTPYAITFGPHSFYWFSLTVPAAVRERPEGAVLKLEELRATDGLRGLTREGVRDRLADVLPRWLGQQRWFPGGAREVKTAAITDTFIWKTSAGDVVIAFVFVERETGPGETYVVPLATVEGERGAKLAATAPQAVVARAAGNGDALIVDALADDVVARAVLEAIRNGANLSDDHLELAATVTAPPGALEPLSDALIQRLDQTEKTSVQFGETVILSLFRRVEEGMHPALEIESRLLNGGRFTKTAPLFGHVEWRKRRGAPTTLAVLHGFVPNRGTAWQATLDELSRFFERVLALPPDAQELPPISGSPLELLDATPPEALSAQIGEFFERAAALGRMTAEMHLALAVDVDDARFRPESFTKLYQRGVYQSSRNLARRVGDALRTRLAAIPESDQESAARYLAGLSDLLVRLRRVADQKIEALRMRYHGDYDLKNLLWTGKDFVVIDFEGKSSRSIADRRVKRSPLRDVVSLIRSIDEAVRTLLYGGSASGHEMIRREDRGVLVRWADHWRRWTSAAFLRGYFEAAGDSFLPQDAAARKVLFETVWLDKTLSELETAIADNSPAIRGPLRAIVSALDEWK
ncbi:MAG TPA: maltose alpha-D-glucosyltransferase, partial [Pirellulales bacterium]